MNPNNYSNRPNIFFYFYSFLFITLFFSIDSYAFQKDSLASKSLEKVVEKKKIIFDQGAREELHRYIGYEDVLPKYISLPYDVTMDTNIAGAFVDIGYLLLMFLPILFLIKIKNGFLKLLVGSSMILFLITSLATGYSAREQVPVEQTVSKLEQEMNNNSQISIFFPIKRSLTQIATSIYIPLKSNVIDSISGEGDSFTYPFLFILFCLFAVLSFNILKSKPKGEQAFLLFFLLYGFLWLILGAGVLWYGILLIPMSMIFINSDILNKNQPNTIGKYILGTFSIIWIIISLTYRFSNYSLPPTTAEMSRGAIHPGPLLYGTGEKSEEELLDFLFPSYAPVLKQINADPTALVYRINTFFHYFISRNNQRILKDDQLNYFKLLQGIYPDKIKLAEYLKKEGYRYIIFDLNTESVDRTPEGSIRKKAAQFKNFMMNNPALEIIGTDAVVLDRNGREINSIYGTKLVRSGKFVAFKIK